jgi:hypothetical protein
MLEKLGATGYEAISVPDEIVMQYVQRKIQDHYDIIYYEIGVGVGATALEVAKIMQNRGQMLLFSLEREVLELSRDLRQLGFANIDSSWGSPSKTYSGYHFELARGFAKGLLPPFDVAYLDGGHTFHLDAPAACVLKELCKPAGFILFDDYTWCLAKSPSLAPERRPQTALDYDPLQIATPHIPLVTRIVMDTDVRFQFCGVHSGTAIYQRRP